MLEMDPTVCNVVKTTASKVMNNASQDCAKFSAVTAVRSNLVSGCGCEVQRCRMKARFRQPVSGPEMSDLGQFQTVGVRSQDVRSKQF